MTTLDITPHRRHRGLAHPLHPQVLGAAVGAAGATTFVHVNASVLPGPWPGLAVGAWGLALVAWVWAVLLRPRRLRDVGPPSPGAGLVYCASVLGMLAAFAGGRAVLAALDRLELMPAVVVLAVGLHFLPFATAFGARVFAVLGWGVAALGLTGLGLGAVLGGPVPAAAAATGTGVAVLVVMVVDALRAPRA